MPGSSRPDPAEWWASLNAEWTEEACKLMSVAAPGTPRARADVAEQALDFFCRNTESFFPCVSDAIKQLAERFELHMASGNPAQIAETLLDASMSAS